MQGKMTDGLGQSDRDDLSAYLDGELPAGRAAEVRRLIREEPAWRRAHRELTALDAALDSYTVPPVPSGLADRILAGVAASELPPGDFEDLSAYLDGELPAERAAEVARRVRDDPLWRRTHAELAATEALLDSYTVVPAPSGLAGRVLARTRRASRRSQGFRAAAWVASAASAAAILLAAFILSGRLTRAPRPEPVVVQTISEELKHSQAFGDLPLAERAEMEAVVVEHYNTDIVRSFLRDYDVVEEFETLEAIERLENEGT